MADLSSTPPSTPPFSARLRALLADRGLTGYAVALRSGLSRSAVSRLLAGQRQPTLATAALLARALDVPLDALAP